MLQLIRETLLDRILLCQQQFPSAGFETIKDEHRVKNSTSCYNVIEPLSINKLGLTALIMQQLK